MMTNALILHYVSTPFCQRMLGSFVQLAARRHYTQLMHGNYHPALVLNNNDDTVLQPCEKSERLPTVNWAHCEVLTDEALR